MTLSPAALVSTRVTVELTLTAPGCGMGDYLAREVEQRLLEIAGILAIIYIPFLANLFKVVPLPAWMWIILALNALVLYSMEWIRKAIVRGMKHTPTQTPATLSVQEVNG